MSKFTDIYKQELKSKGVLSSLASAAGKRIREKTDIRNILFGGKGIFSATGQKIFGKGYSATAAAQRSPLTSTTPSKTTDLLVQNLEAIAKNTSPISGMRKDIGYIRKDVNAILKILSSKAIGGAGGGGGGGVSNLVMLNMMKNLTKFLTSKAAIGTAIGAGTIGALSFGANKLRGMTNEELQKEENANVPSNRAEREGITKGQAAAKNAVEARAQSARTKAQANDAVKVMADQKLSGAAADDFLRSYFGPVNTPTLQQILEECDSNVKDLYLKKIAETKTKPITSAQTPAPSATPTPAATQDWRAAERASYGNAPSPAPSNAVTTTEGTPVMTGTGGFVTSGQPTPTAPSKIRKDLSLGEAINNAAKITGVPNKTLAIFGQIESSLGKFVESKSSTAKGPFQFIEGTWLDMMNKHGKKYGFDASKMSREEQLNLRFNNELSALLAAEYTKENARVLKIDPTDASNVDKLYLAHFLGAGGAKNVLSGKGLSEEQKQKVMKSNSNIKTASNQEFMEFAKSKTEKASKVTAVQDIVKMKEPSSGTALASATQESSTLRTQMAAAPAQPIVITQPSAPAPQQKSMQQTQVASAFNENAVDLFLNNTLGLGA